jgi:O-antigen ligase
VANTLENFIDKSQEISFLALAIATPLIFTTQTTELFEVPKMFFVYFVSAMIFSLIIVKSYLSGKVKVPAGPVTIAFAVFTVVQIASTLFSTDKYLSIYGYPTRLNGGMLSQFAYFILLAGGITTLSTQKARQLLIAIVIAATAVSLWGIPAHFNRDPSCLVLTGNLTSSCWQQDFNPILRIFSTLGQPNWLASYLVLALPFSLAFLLIHKSPKAKIFFAISSAAIFMALVLTNSRAGILGAGISIAILLILLGVKFAKNNFKPIAAILTIFFIIWMAFGTLLTSRLLEALNTNKLKVTNQNSKTSQNSRPAQTSLTSGGTESSQIRFIVWQGALKVFERWPILGSGPETFVSTYFLFRPASHNQTTEWEFYYNKAHNEFLNYLANTGILGLASYLAFVSVILFRLIKKNPQEKLPITTKAAVAATAGYLTTIFFGFSTVATQTTFFLIIPASIVLKDNEKIKSIKINLNKSAKTAAIALTSVLGLYVLTLVLRLFIADTFEKRAETYQSTSPSRELLAYDNAQTTSPAKNPYLMANFAYSAAVYAQDIENPKSSQSLINRADSFAQKTASISPNNFLIIQNVAKTYLLLAQKNPEFESQAINYSQILPKLAPTYPISYLTLAKTQIALGKNAQAQASLEKALRLKPDYQEAKDLLEQINSNTYNKNETAPLN